ncbi:MAG: hypothetical protein GW802_36055 [Armatimonadetes bacterium]|nr:hypothetical protein [Armatimonadota bacterium]
MKATATSLLLGLAVIGPLARPTSGATYSETVALCGEACEGGNPCGDTPSMDTVKQKAAKVYCFGSQCTHWKGPVCTFGPVSPEMGYWVEATCICSWWEDVHQGPDVDCDCDDIDECATQTVTVGSASACSFLDHPCE